MTIINADRVRENTTAQGTGPLPLLGAVRNFRTFLDGVGSGNQCYYAITHQTLNEWEVGLGTFTLAAGIPTLARNTVYSSSNGNALVNFSAGTKQAAVIYPGIQIDTIASNVGLAAGYAVAASSDAALASTAAANALIYKTSASAYATEAQLYAASASAYYSAVASIATELSGLPVDVSLANVAASNAQQYAASASAYATQAEGYSSAAQIYKTSASAFASEAAQSASLAGTYKTSASAYATEAATYASLALIYKVSASAYVAETAANASLALIYKTSASAYATQAADSASLAAYYASLANPQGSAKLSVTQTFTGANTFTSAATFNTSVSISNSLVVAGPASFTSAVTFNTSVSVSGTTNFADNEVIQAKFRDYALTHVALASVSATTSIDLVSGNYFSALVNGSTTWVFVNPPASPNAGGFILELTNGGGFTMTWPTAVKWPGGTPPTFTTSGVDMATFITDDGGTTWRGVQSMKDSR